MLTSEAKDWTSESIQLPEFDQWKDAQALSLKAVEECNSFKDLVFPLTRSFKKIVLTQIWGKIDQVGRNRILYHVPQQLMHYD